jgi:hypothetical protein
MSEVIAIDSWSGKEGRLKARTETEVIKSCFETFQQVRNLLLHDVANDPKRVIIFHDAEGGFGNAQSSERIESNLKDVSSAIAGVKDSLKKEVEVSYQSCRALPAEDQEILRPVAEQLQLFPEMIDEIYSGKDLKYSTDSSEKAFDLQRGDFIKNMFFRKPVQQKVDHIRLFLRMANACMAEDIRTKLVAVLRSIRTQKQNLSSVSSFGTQLRELRAYFWAKQIDLPSEQLFPEIYPRYFAQKSQDTTVAKRVAECLHNWATVNLMHKTVSITQCGSSSTPCWCYAHPQLEQYVVPFSFTVEIRQNRGDPSQPLALVCQAKVAAVRIDASLKRVTMTVFPLPEQP